VFQPHLNDFAQWKTEYDVIKERVDRHLIAWKPTIAAWNAARNKKAGAEL
jgi:hypothetical protein